MSQVDDVKQEIREMVKRALGISLASDEQNFFLEAGVDSLAFLNVVQALEKKYPIKFKNDTLPDLSCASLLAGEVVRLLDAKKAAG